MSWRRDPEATAAAREFRKQVKARAAAKGLGFYRFTFTGPAKADGATRIESEGSLSEDQAKRIFAVLNEKAS